MSIKISSINVVITNFYRDAVRFIDVPLEEYEDGGNFADVGDEDLVPFQQYEVCIPRCALKFQDMIRENELIRFPLTKRYTPATS